MDTFNSISLDTSCPRGAPSIQKYSFSQARYAKRRLTHREGKTWKHETDKIKTRFGIDTEGMPWTSAHDLAGVNETARVVDCIETVHAVAKSKDLDLNGLVVMYTESHNWCVKALGREKLSCVKATGDYYSYKLDRSLIPEELANIMGFVAPRIRDDFHADLARVNERDAVDLLGNGMAVGHVAAVLTAIALHFPGLYS